MDPLFLNLGVPQSPPPPVGSTCATLRSRSSPTLNQINGIPQESKLATYISNRQQFPIPNRGNVSSQNEGDHQDVSTSQTNSTYVLSQSALPNSTITKSLAALGLDSITSKKSGGVSSVGEFGAVPAPSGGGMGPSLSHSASTPSFQSFTATSPHSSTHVTTSPSSPLRVHSPLSQPSPIRGVSAPPMNAHKTTSELEVSTSSSGAALPTYHENVRGTTYFYTSQDISYNPSTGAPPSQSHQNSFLFLPYHVSPPTPSHIHHMKAPTHAPHFFMGDELRNEILEKQVLAHIQSDPDQNRDIPTEIDLYNEFISLEPPNSIHKSSMFGYATSVYKATNMKNGLYYCLYRVHGYRLTNTKVTHIVDIWKNLQHTSLIQLREVFTTKEFGDNSIVFVYDFHAGAETLSSKHFSSLGLVSSNWERLVTSLSASGQAGAAASSNINSNLETRNEDSIGMLPESLLWNYIIQLTGAVRAIHTQGLACRTLEAAKILCVDRKSRIRINCCGILDVLNFDPNATNPLAGVHTYQQEDLVNLGKLIVSLACRSNLALQRDNISTSIDLINRHYSRDLATLVVCLLTSQRVKSVNDVMPIIGARFYAALESSTQRGDIYEAELWKEVHNGRLFRLLTKLNTIIDRPHLNQDTCWSEAGDRFMLKLFRNFIFHQQTDEGHPWIDLGHITSVLNKLDSGSHDKICLMSTNEQNILVASYAELKKCFERSFQEIVDACSTDKSNSLS